MKPIPNGARGRYVHRVEPAHLANRFKDSILPPVFSTPYLILIMENAALNAIKQYLGEGESAVGTRVDVRHLVATPVGREVVGHAEVMRTEGRRIFFRVWAMDGEETIGIGIHERAVVATARIVEQMAAKYGPAAAQD
ncbi:MAG TPA: thioesterase family protein [Steroidobacteraceae bacterium]|nr:thioesterase family protein [Steroidobacteraceae bacterium]HEV2443864.1 thioesterase family protein [Steroidobacteraceae bacterium]